MLNRTAPLSPRLPALPATSPRHRSSARIAGLILGLLLVGTASLQALSVRQMSLDDLCAKAQHVVRGEVVEVQRGSVEAGGGSLPTVTYRLKVRENFAGAAYGYFEFTCLATGDKAGGTSLGQVRHRLPIELPELKPGQEYVLFATPPSRIGLSSLVGLGQGCFEVQSSGGKETAVNERSNVGLGLPQTGPIAYEELAAAIRQRLAK